ncbi:hypothetical protein BH18CHL1_BH18CHL1_03990 [soil metagenome]
MASLGLGGSIRTRPRGLDAPPTSTVSADRFGWPRPAGPTHDGDPIASSIPVALVSAARGVGTRLRLRLAWPSAGFAFGWLRRPDLSPISAPPILAARGSA